ncbi:MAG: hypothetical protein JO266_06705 [Acidobacteria bacterium]|nr:hypothetical protein [Acidobacteriota bacterium]MBV9480286.1 hypothetical protein [Acidobacteriota bacterium]
MKTPSLGKLYKHRPKWWHQAQPRAVTPESFWPAPDASPRTRDKSRFEKLAQIAIDLAKSGKRKQAV